MSGILFAGSYRQNGTYVGHRITCLGLGVKVLRAQKAPFKFTSTSKVGRLTSNHEVAALLATMARFVLQKLRLA